MLSLKNIYFNDINQPEHLLKNTRAVADVRTYLNRNQFHSENLKNSRVFSLKMY